MAALKKNPRILIVTPEVTYLPKGMGNIANYLTAKAGGLADVSAALINTLFKLGADVHVALPDYRALFAEHRLPVIKKEVSSIRATMPEDRIHLAQDRAFFYMDRVYSNYDGENEKIALAFQREVINHIIPTVNPDLIHCNDWMTGLIPGTARQLAIPCLFTVHNIHTIHQSLAQIEDRGIDAAAFWKYLYYTDIPYNYEDTRETIPIDFLCSGIFAAHFVNTVSPTFLKEIVEKRHRFIEKPLQEEISAKYIADCAVGILNAPDPTFNPKTDQSLIRNYEPTTHHEGKLENKLFFQENLGLITDRDAPVFFWPSRLDTTQKGCQLLAQILFAIVSDYWESHLEIIIVANGEYKKHFQDIVHFHSLHDRVAICEFDENLARLAYAASDFVLMPSYFEPCGLPQMIGPLYGSLPVAHDTGGIHDTVFHLNETCNVGNGFLFETADSQGFRWAIDQAISFWRRPQTVRQAQIERIMIQSVEAFNHTVTARQYIDLYEKMLKRPLVKANS